MGVDPHLLNCGIEPNEPWQPSTMLLTISTTHQPATDLGYLLHKHPERCQIV